MISSLLNTIFIALKTLAEFLTVLLLGLIVGILIILPWLLWMLALIGWLWRSKSEVVVGSYS